MLFVVALRMSPASMIKKIKLFAPWPGDRVLDRIPSCQSVSFAPLFLVHQTRLLMCDGRRYSTPQQIRRMPEKKKVLST